MSHRDHPLAFLFLISINDLPHTLSDTGTILFAEDTVLYSSGTNRYTIQHKVQRDLSSLESWCIENQLTINAKKPQYVIFSTGRQKDKCSGIKLRIEEHNLSEVDDYKYLGTILDSKLTGGKAVQPSCAQSCAQRIGRVHTRLSSSGYSHGPIFVTQTVTRILCRS